MLCQWTLWPPRCKTQCVPNSDRTPFYFAPVGGYTSSDPIQFIGPLTTGAKVPSLSSKVALSTVSQLLASGHANARPVSERLWIVENLVFSVTIGSQDSQLMAFIHLMVPTYLFVAEKTAKVVPRRDLLDALNRRI